MRPYAAITVTPKGESSLLKGHPWVYEAEVSAIDGVTAAHVNFLTTKMTLEGEEARMDELAKKAEAAVKSVDPDVEVKRIG